MKISTIVGVASLALNVGLIGVIALGLTHPAAPGTAGAKAPAPVLTPAAAAAPLTWSELASGDVKALRERLMKQGFPPATIRAVMMAQIREQFAARRRALEGGEQPFWRAGYDPAKAAQLRALAKEETQAAKDLLGADYFSDAVERLQRQLPELPADKIEQVLAIRARYDEQRQDVYAMVRGMFSPVDQEKIAALEKAQHAELASVLTPAELESHDLRMSNVANSLRSGLGDMELTEAEFRALYKLQSEWEERFPRTGTAMTPEQSRLRMEAQKQLNSDMETALGSDRYKEYERARDYYYRQTTLLTSRLGLPSETAVALYSLQKEAEQRRTALFNGQPISGDRAAEFYAGLRQEMTARITTILGGNQTAVEAYRATGGAWLQNFSPPKPAAKK